jgi:hypothetical protein
MRIKTEVKIKPNIISLKNLKDFKNGKTKIEKRFISKLNIARVCTYFLLAHDTLS